jgi:hypothetical protein
MSKKSSKTNCRQDLQFTKQQAGGQAVREAHLLNLIVYISRLD